MDSKSYHFSLCHFLFYPCLRYRTTQRLDFLHSLYGLYAISNTQSCSGFSAAPVFMLKNHMITIVLFNLRYSFTKHSTLTGHRDEMTMYSNIDYTASLGGYYLTEKDILRVNRKYGCEVKSNATTTTAPMSTASTTASSNGNQTTSNNSMVSTTVSSSTNMTTQATTQASNHNMTTAQANGATTQANNTMMTTTSATVSTTVQQSTMDLGNFTTPPVNGTNTSLWGSPATHQTPSHPITFIALFMGSLAVLFSFV